MTPREEGCSQPRFPEDPGWDSRLDPASAKKALRSSLLALRDRLPEGLRGLWSRRILDRLRLDSRFLSSRFPAFTFPFGSEVDTRVLLRERLQQGLPVLLPATLPEGRMRFHRIARPLEELRPGEFGIPEPDPRLDPEVESDGIDLVVAPGLGFDPSGYRIGRGGGYFDRFLAGLPQSVPVLGLAFEKQILESLPVETFDRRVDAVLTERTVYREQRLSWETGSVEQTHALAAQTAACLEPPVLVRLEGELGAGKTEWVRGYLAGLGWTGRVKSPTFTLENVYPVSEDIRVYHLDGYRLDAPSELDLEALEEILEDPGSMVLVEWPDRFGPTLGPFHPRLSIERLPSGKRRFDWWAAEEKHRLPTA